MVTMMYMGQGLNKTSQEEVKVLQQVCGGENLCVFKGSVQPGEQFQFRSQRHVGFPFSATFYVNGIMSGRISSCCEYRYTPGAHQGKKSCFRLTRLAGGKPCYRCVNARYVTTPQPLPQNNVPESCPSSPLFVPMGTERSLRGLRAPSKDGNCTSTDSEELEGTRRGRARAKSRKQQPSLRRSSKASEVLQDHIDERLPDNRQRGQEARVNVAENRCQKIK
ncbi:glutamate-rich protein 3 [Sardina pilchardus]|uniref:glutamate-rich protein 3 n=1 Tax=Sardina pilchardus TaxID=27697 RepID=UPI002E15F576